MHDIKFIRKDPAAFDAALARRGLPPQSAEILAADKQARGSQQGLEALKARSNELAREIGQLMGQGKREEAAPLMAESKEVKAKLAALKDTPEATDNEATIALLETIPNLLAEDVPDGKNESDNVELHRIGTPAEHTPAIAHDDLGAALYADGHTGQMDFERAALLSGSRFSVLKGDIARLERALYNFALDTLIERYDVLEVSPPLLVRDAAMYGTGQLPKFTEDLYQTKEGFWLIPTAEVPLTNLVRDDIIDTDILPLRYAARTPCFRSEAGSAGKDTRGFLRLHQFMKVEMVTIAKPDESEAEHQRMLNASEALLQQLEIPYRVIVLCSGDTGFSAQKTYDIEAWIPSQATYREVASISNCGAFQARRMNARYRAKNDKETQFLHTLNGTGMTGRVLIAIMEQYQNDDGSITVPEVLRPYLQGQEVIA